MISLPLNARIAVEVRHPVFVAADPLAAAILRQRIKTNGSIAEISVVPARSATFTSEAKDLSSVVAVLRAAATNSAVRPTTTYVVFLTSTVHYVADGENHISVAQQTAIEQTLDACAHIVAPNMLLAIFPADLKFVANDSVFNTQRRFERNLSSSGVWHLTLPFTRAQLTAGTHSMKVSCALAHQKITYMYLQRSDAYMENMQHYAAFNVFSLAKVARLQQSDAVYTHAVTECVQNESVQLLVLQLTSMTLAEKLESGDGQVNSLVALMTALMQVVAPCTEH